MISNIKKSHHALLFAFLMATSSNALASCDTPPPLNEVTFHLTAEKWVQTTTAKITISINATLNNKTLSQMREQIMANLNKITKGQWHITDFERSQDSSGLEKLYVEAEARVNESSLTNVNTEAQALSVPGVKYKVKNIDFTPSMKDIEEAKKDLRKTIYQDASTEISTLNTTYPEQKYVLHAIHFGEFSSNGGGMRAMPMVMMAGASQTQNGESPAVSNLITLTADVDIASKGLPSSDKKAL